MDSEKRNARAKSMAAMGLVKRDGDHFQVSTPSLRGKQTSYKVWRDSGEKVAGKVMCNCLEFQETFQNNDAFRCEHILAVKYALVAKNTEVLSTPVETVKQAETSGKAATIGDSGVIVGVDSGTEDGDFGVVSFPIPKNGNWLTCIQVEQIGDKAQFSAGWNEDFFKDFASPSDLKKFMMAMFKFYMKLEQDLWSKFGDESDPKVDSSEYASTGFPANPIARSLSDLVTAKQLGMMRALCREMGIDPDEECATQMDCKTDELSRKAASAFIQFLQEKQNG